MPNPLISKVEGNQNYVPSAPSVSQGPVHITMDPHKLIAFVPSYDGDAYTIYNYLNSASQWLKVAGETPQNVMLLLSKLTGRAALIVSMIEHGFVWKNIEVTLKKECGDNRELNTLLVELANVKKKGSYKDLIFELKQKLFFIKCKLHDKYNNPAILDEMMEAYINTAQNTLQNSLPYHDQIYVTNCSFNETSQKILQLEAAGRFDNIRQKFSNVIPPPKLVNQNFAPPRFINPQQRPINMPVVNNASFHRRYPWSANPNNAFSRPPHKFFAEQRNNYPPRVSNPQSQPQDVSMRTAPQLKPGQINLGKGFVAEEVYYHPEEGENCEYPEFTPDYQNPDYFNDLPPNCDPELDQNFHQSPNIKDES